MSGTSNDKDDDAGTLISPACPGYRHHFGLGKPPQPTVTPMQHASALEYTEREAPCHRPVRKEGGKEAQTAGGGGTVGDLGEGLSGLQ